MKNAGWKPELQNGHDICPYKTKRPGLNRDALSDGTDSTSAVLHLLRKRLVMTQNGVSA
jgi:hypothetical protein